MARMPAVRPDVAVLDVRLPDGDGISVCREISSALPGTACLMLTGYGDDQALLGAIMAGAAGYVSKQTAGTDLVSALRAVASGQSILDPHASAQVMARLRQRAVSVDPVAALSEQEKRVLELIGEGLTNRLIAERMFLAEKTVKNYVSALLTKLGMQRRTQAAAFAVRHSDDRDELPGCLLTAPATTVAAWRMNRRSRSSGRRSLTPPTRGAWPSSTGSCSACATAPATSRPLLASQIRPGRTG
jgi:DNA-binding NarL/FixJ family response regulator